jgi:hypothetical protein
MDGTWDGYRDADNHEIRLLANLMGVSVQFYDELIDLLLR